MYFELHSLNFISYIDKKQKQLDPWKDNPVFPIK